MKTLNKQLIIFFTTGAYSGYSPFASGTAGSLVGLLIYLIMPAPESLLYLLITLSILMVGVWASNLAEPIFKKKDPGEIVIDEIVGMLISLYLIPFSWQIFIAAFFLFRIMDIIKPFRRLENLPGGWGIMMDDVMAAVITNLILQVIVRF